MSFLLQMLGALGGWLVKLVPIFLAYRAGVKDVQAEELEKQNDELRKDAALSDTAIADKLRERAERKNRNKR